MKLPDGKLTLPGVVEHPELVADRIENFAKLGGRENMIASTDYGLGGRTYLQIAWAKLEAMSQGAEVATRRRWSWRRRVPPHSS